MARTLSKKRTSAKYDVVIKAKATTTRIVDINNDIVRLESMIEDKSLENIIQEFTGTR
jgi:hypothetical protein